MPIPTEWWFRPSAVPPRRRAQGRGVEPVVAQAAAATLGGGTLRGPPKGLAAPKPTSSSRITRTLGAPSVEGAVRSAGTPCPDPSRRTFQPLRRPVWDRQHAAGVPVWAHGRPSVRGSRSAPATRRNVRRDGPPTGSPGTDHPQHRRDGDGGDDEQDDEAEEDVQELRPALATSSHASLDQTEHVRRVAPTGLRFIVRESQQLWRSRTRVT